jgi:hypothetical protein
LVKQVSVSGVELSVVKPTDESPAASISKKRKLTTTGDGKSSDGNALQLLAKQLSGNAKQALISSIVRDRSHAARQLGISIITQLVEMLGDKSFELSAILPALFQVLKSEGGGQPHGTDASLRIDALYLLQNICTRYPPTQLSPYVERMSQPIVQCLQDPFYRVNDEALHTAGHLVHAVVEKDQEAQTVFLFLFRSIQAKLEQADIDLQVRQAAMESLTAFLTNVCNCLPTEDVERTVQSLCERLRNEVTRQCAICCLCQLASSDSLALAFGGGVLQRFSADLIAECCQLLRKTIRPLRLGSLDLLEGLLEK